jgi:PAS domain S-box-containing protein
MNGAPPSILVAIVVQLGLGLAVLQSNWHRKANQSFLILSLAAAAWLGSLYFILGANNVHAAEVAIRAASVAGILIITSLNLLRLSLRRDRESWPSILKRSRWWFIGLAFVTCLCLTKFFLQGARFGNTRVGVAPIPTYGPGIHLFSVYFCGAMLLLLIATWRNLRETAGAIRVELGFILIGGLFALVVSLPLSLLLGTFFSPAVISQTAPFRVILFSLVVAYGIATRKIMEVGLFLRRAMSYLILATYLTALYAVFWWLTAFAAHSVFHSENHAPAYVIAALVIAFAMAPARGFSQRLADKLFIRSQGIDFRATMGKAAAILSSVTTLHDLLRRFATTIAEAVGTDRVIIYLAGKKGEFLRKYPREGDYPARLNSLVSTDGPLVHYLNNYREPLVLEELHRVRRTPATERVKQRLEELSAAVALGIFARENLVGIMLLGPRLSGRIYGSMEQDALHLLCGQLAVAVENAELFTEVQNAKLYNETLVQNLTIGVVAADTDGKITVFNHEAEQITGLSKTNKGRVVDDLPVPLRIIIRTTLATSERQEDKEASFEVKDEEVYVRASSAIFRGQEHEVLGALMVITDITTLKKMEEQIRRTDRLASLGTLSAGMAHEIKNPLVSIKTFAQLLPERYAESDFRETFSGLIVHEINRIDTLVNQLLRFARPTKPLLRPMHVHDTLEKTLLLVQHRLYQKEIKVVRAFDSPTDLIRADSDQLEQVFLNFFLNAMDAMKRGGELTVGTEIRTGDPLISQLSVNGAQADEALCISIRDTGEGIKPGDIPHVFDPFFTTKDHGTGLGLSVVHGIVQEHGGQIEVESELAQGTVFRIFMPLARDSQEVAAA